MPTNFCIVKKANDAYAVRLSSMKLGTHSFEFELNKAFFESIEQSLIEDGEVFVKVNWEKKETMMVVHFSLLGTVNTTCDRCNDPVSVPIHGQYKLVYKFGTEPSIDENLIVLDPESIEVDLRDQLYEFTVISLPNRIVHPEGECNEEVMKLYEKYIVNSNEPEPDDEDEWDDEDWDEEDEAWLRDQLGDDDDEDADDEGEEDDDDDFDPDKPIDPRWAALQNLKKE